MSAGSAVLRLQTSAGIKRFDPAQITGYRVLVFLSLRARQKMAALICGSLAYDTIMTFEGRFKEQILPEQLHIS